jgi:hypothetical protein
MDFAFFSTPQNQVLKIMLPKIDRQAKKLFVHNFQSIAINGMAELIFLQPEEKDTQQPNLRTPFSNWVSLYEHLFCKFPFQLRTIISESKGVRYRKDCCLFYVCL